MPTITLHPRVPQPQQHSQLDAAVSSSSSFSPPSSLLPDVLRTPSGLALVEIQGTLNATTSEASSGTSASGEGGGSAATPIGRLVFPLYDASLPASATDWHKRVHLYIGRHQRLTGELKKLSRPIAVIRRRSHGVAGRADMELEIADVVYYKLLLAHRPEPVGTVS